jgi:hypothetical protein
MCDYCRYCDEEAIEERIADIKHNSIVYENWDNSDVQELFEDEIGLCRECQKEEDADMERDEY